MGTPKGDLKGFRYFPGGGTFADSGAGVVQTVGQDSHGDQVRIFGKFSTDGAGAIADVQGEGFTVAYTGVGIYTITFTDGFTALQYANATTQVQASGSATDLVGEVSAFTAGVAGACTLIVLAFTGAAAADMAVGDYLCFEAVLLSEWQD